MVVCKVVGQGPRVFWRVQESLLYNSKGVKALWGIIADVVVESDDDVVPRSRVSNGGFASAVCRFCAAA